MEVSLRRGLRSLLWGGLLTAMGFGQVRAQSAVPTNVVSARPGVIANVVRPAVAPLQKDLDDEHHIRPGDKLSYRIDEDREEARVLPVTDSGEIELPYFGRFPAANKTCRVLANDIKTALEKEYYHHATVHIGLDTANKERGRVYVFGQVAKPGPVTLPADSSLKLSQAIVTAGPPTQWAKLSDVRVVRKKGEETQTIRVNVDAVLNGGRLNEDIVLEPDDTIVVPERGVIFK